MQTKIGRMGFESWLVYMEVFVRIMAAIPPVNIDTRT